MTNKEIDKLLSMVDKKSLDDVKKYLFSEKAKLIQNAFENYMCNQGVAFNQFGNNRGLLYILVTMKLYSQTDIVFT